MVTVCDANDGAGRERYSLTSKRGKLKNQPAITFEGKTLHAGPPRVAVETAPHPPCLPGGTCTFCEEDTAPCRWDEKRQEERDA